MNPTLRLLAALGLAAVATTASAEGDAAAGRIKFETCRGCHSVPGYTNAFPVYHVPKIGGQHAARVVAALTAYRNGERKHPTMVAQAASLTDQDMQDIAAYLAGEKVAHAPRAGLTAPEKAAVCATCHGADGVAPSPEFPVLAGQHRDYLVRALTDYKSGARSNMVMAPMAMGLTPADIDALARWFAAQNGPLQSVP
jgi:cytochrome c553